MPHPFRIETSVEIEATPEEVWEALTIGDQLDGWWIGAPNEVEPRLGGKVRQTFGGEVSESTITAWDPPHHFVDEGTPGPDGVVHAMEFTLEGRSGTTTVRFVHSGFLGDDWESEYEALAEGDPMYIHQLAEYVRFFRGRPVAIVEHFQPDIADRQAAMAILRGAMGLGDAVAVGDAVRLEPAGLGPVEGSVDYVVVDHHRPAHRRRALPVRVHPDGWRHLHGPPRLPGRCRRGGRHLGLGGVAGPGRRGRPGGVSPLSFPPAAAWMLWQGECLDAPP